MGPGPAPLNCHLRVQQWQSRGCAALTDVQPAKPGECLCPQGAGVSAATGARGFCGPRGTAGPQHEGIAALLPGNEAPFSLTFCSPSITWLSWTKKGGLEKKTTQLRARGAWLWPSVGAVTPNQRPHASASTPRAAGVTVAVPAALHPAGSLPELLCECSSPFGGPLAPSACVCLVTRCQPARASLQELQTPVLHMLAPPAYLGPRQTANCCADVMFQAGMRL